MLHNEYEGKAV